MMKIHTLHMATDEMKLRHAFYKPFTVRFPDRSEWGRGSTPIKKGGLIWYTDWSKTNEGTGGEVYGHGMWQRFSFSLGHYTTVFQAEVYAINTSKIQPQASLSWRGNVLGWRTWH
jgi:hypothetical protein